MKPISLELEAHIASECTTLATCWKLTRQDATVLGFTSHDRSIIIEEVTYQASGGFTPSAIDSRVGLAVDNLDVQGMLSSDAIRQEDIHAGLYDAAEIEIFQVNYADISQGTLPLRRGFLGKVEMKGGQFVAEIRGMQQPLSQGIGELYSPSCRAQLGDSRCKITLSPDYVKTGTITSLSHNRIFFDSEREEANDFFSQGKITFNSGNNAGLSMEVKRYTVEGGRIELVFPMPFAVEEGDSYSLQAGCDKTLPTCITRFNNALNFRGEPFVPGTDKMLETSSTRNN
ncbi:MAG: hypothetical protein K0R63_961 [Rickettsiales bacterium]|jgi:uncharacterized phage protein (TIGR02218 family)|nr:hypothetical protein [Rickettsiales bacterium]